MDRARRPTLETPPGDAPDTAVPPEVRRGEATPLGRPGKPFDRRSPFRLGFFTTFGVAIAVALIAAVVAVRDLLVLIFLAAFIAVGLNPVVDALCRRGMRRVLAVALVAVVGLALLAGFLSAVVPAIAAQVNHLVAAAPTYLTNLQQNNATFARLDRQLHLVQHLSSSTREIELRVAGGLLGVSKVVLSVVFSTVTVIVLTLYFLANLPGIKRTAYRLVPASRRQRVAALGDEALDRVGGYLLGRVVLALFAGIGTFLFLLVVGVPYPAALGGLVTLLDFIPILGSMAAGIIIVLVAFTVSLPIGIATLVFFVVYRMIEDYLIAPRVMFRTIDVPPVVTIVAVFLGGALVGVAGAVVAIPVAAGVELVLNEVLFPRIEAA